MIHGNPSNSTPIFLSARATPDGKLAYDLLYQVRSPSIVTYFVRNQSPRPWTRHARASTSRFVQNLEPSVLLYTPVLRWAASGRLARPWTGTPNPWKRRSNPEKIRTRVGTGDGCPHPRRLRSRRSSIIRIQSPQALSIGCLTASKMHWRRRHEERHGRTADAVLWIIGRGSAPTIKSYHAGGDPHLPSQILGFQTRPEHFRPLCNECLKHQ